MNWIFKKWEFDWDRVVGDIEAINKKTHGRHYLSYNKIRVLWNLPEKEARLKIVSKLQDPFNDRPEFFYTFRDDPEILLYDLYSKIQDIETKLLSG